jgi:hypothetical protein
MHVSCSKLKSAGLSETVIGLDFSSLPQAARNDIAIKI